MYGCCFNYITERTAGNSRHNRPPLRDLTREVTPLVVEKWYDLGLELLEPKYEKELEVIQKNNSHDVKVCCRNTFRKWLDTKTDASWGELIQAVKNIELNYAASSIEKFVQSK